MLSIEGLLARYPDDVRACVKRLRELVRSWVPEAQEQVYPGWKAIGYRSADAGYFCGLFPQDDHVLIAFERGASLSDPAGVLERPRTGRASGTLRYFRVAAHATNSLDVRVLAPFVIEAASLSSATSFPNGSPRSPRPTRGAPR